MERQRQTVPIAGINRAENDLTVQDGCCETLHNLRYDAGAWRNVETFRQVAEITDFGGFTLLYKHPATADDLYIASDESGTIHEVRVSGGRLSSTQVIMCGVSELWQTFSFGNVLVFITDGRELYYVLYGNEYVAFDMPEPGVFQVAVLHLRLLRRCDAVQHPLSRLHRQAEKLQIPPR